MFEFDLIQRYFRQQPVQRNDVRLGIGDDAAIVTPAENLELVIAADVLNEGIHFPVATDAAAIGHKALAVNLSDMAAMGAEPAWFTMTLSIPDSNASWLDAFCSGLYQLAAKYNVQLIGGDTVQGPLSISVQIAGYVTPGAALTRSGARVGDGIYVTGVLGDSAAALACINGEVDIDGQAIQGLQVKLDYPEPCVCAGQKLAGVATAAIDISDGLLADLGHILQQSNVGAHINIDAIPVSDNFRTYIAAGGDFNRALVFGDDYELCFTSPLAEPEIVELLKHCDCGVTLVGSITSGTGLKVTDSQGNVVNIDDIGFEHFAE